MARLLSKGSLGAIVAYATWVWVSALGCQSTPQGPNPYPALAAEEGSWLGANDVQFHSRLEAYRAPSGPVAVGQTVRFRLKSRKGRLNRVSLRILDQFIEGNQASVTWTELSTFELRWAEEEGWDVWEGEFTPDYPATLGYVFILEGRSSPLALGNNDLKVNVPHVDVTGTGGQGRLTAPSRAIPFPLTAYLPTALEGPPEDIVYYYIFPERFRNGNKSNDPRPGQRRFYGDLSVEYHQDWAQPEPFKPGDGRSDREWNNDFYGGDLEGILERLDHIASLGTTHLYMTPIFYALSNHKYDHADYHTIDPGFGDERIFRRLLEEAAKRGIGVILDASLNHTGADSIYFDRWGKWPGVGAFENEQIRTDSPYYEWYEFYPNARHPDRRYRQWAVPSLAELTEVDSWKDFAFRRPDSVCQRWLALGIAGWRMDVTPWVSDEFWVEWRQVLRQRFPRSLLICETWFLSTKYLTGTTFDGTMNYLFRAATLNFARGGSPFAFRQAMELMLEVYPAPALRRSMSLISSHDVPRALYELGYSKNTDPLPDVIRRRFLLAVALQYLSPGAPTIYYGDEVGVTGGPDPYNRAPFPWPDAGAQWGKWDLLPEFQRLAELRRRYREALVFGSLRFLDTSGLLTFERQASSGKTVVVSLNNTTADQTLNLENRSPITVPALGWILLE